MTYSCVEGEPVEDRLLNPLEAGDDTRRDR